MDHVRNDDIMDKVEVEFISARCKISQLRYLRHVEKRKQQNVCRCTLEMMPPERRKRRRPNLR